MANFWDYIKGLFKEAEESSPTQPVVHELIKRSETEKEDFQQWKQGLVCKRMNDWLMNQYAIFGKIPDDIDEALDFLDTPSSKGFAIHFNQTRYNRRDVTHFFDSLKEKVLELNYRTQISDTRTFNRSNWVENIQRHYLKPRPNFQKNEKLDQQYGNILIELVFHNDDPYQLRFSATTYKDHQFKDALAFKELMANVLF